MLCITFIFCQLAPCLLVLKFVCQLKVKLSLCKQDSTWRQALQLNLHTSLGFQKVEPPSISRQTAHEGGKVVRPTHRSPLSPPPGDTFLLDDRNILILNLNLGVRRMSVFSFTGRPLYLQGKCFVSLLERKKAYYISPTMDNIKMHFKAIGL